MCVYNTPILYLREAVDSVLGQTYRNIEFVIVDDASDDAEVIGYLNCLERIDNRVKVIRNKGNLGLTQSLNIGLSYCGGKYIARMDSDDISLPQRIEKQFSYMERNPKVVLVGSNVINFGDGISDLNVSVEYDIFDDPERYKICSLFQHSGPSHPTFMFRTSFLKDNRIGYRYDILKAQDYGIMADILKKKGEIRKIKEPLLKYRIHSGQITSGHELEQKAYQCRVSYDYIRFMFPDLTDGESAAISLLGFNGSYKNLKKAINDYEDINKACEFIIKNSDCCENSNYCIRAIRKIIKFNNQNGTYDKKTFAKEIRQRWWKKVVRTWNNEKRIWGIYPYTLICFLQYKRCRKNRNLIW